jgi:type IV pilus assembly protein PilB
VPNVSLSLARVLAERLQQQSGDLEIPWLSLGTQVFDPRLWSLFPDHMLRSHRIAPLWLRGRTMAIAMVDPQDVAGVDALTQAVPAVRYKIFAVGAEDWQRFVDGGTGKRAPSRASEASLAPDVRPRITFLEDEEQQRRGQPMQNLATGPQIIGAVDEIISTGLGLRASDIHVEHERGGVLVRYRVDGSLQSRPQLFPLEMARPIVSRLKLLGKLDITETRKPQDGRISLKAGTKLIDLRVSTMPAKLGEKLVMRILDAEGSILDLKMLMPVDKLRQIFSQMIFRPNGLVMVTGPTGSGKTTTLYSALNARRRPELNMVTVEDPIEYHLDGVTQVQVQPDVGVTFETILRGLLRQDPDVILVGETRDRETARIAVEASMTGHLVLTSVHTNGALDAVVRLADLGVERYAIANGLLGVLHQRLVRRCCASCTEPFDYPEPIVEMLYKVGAFLPGEKPVLQRGKGCQRCNGTGFRGRVGVYELLSVNETVRDAIASGADQAEIRTAAGGGALIDLARYAGILVGSGATVPGEVLHMLQRVG